MRFMISAPSIPECSALVAFGVVLVTACSHEGQGDQEKASAPSLTVDAGRDAGADSATVTVGGTCQRAWGESRRDRVCQRWRCEAREGVDAARWNGDPVTCSAGDVDIEAGERAARVINLHRFLADLPPVSADWEWSEAAQGCALLAHANAKLSHTPGPDWRCWSDIAAKAAGVSLVANRSVPIAIGAFMEDPGNEQTMVHRRWLLSPELQRIGLGSTDRYSCVVVDGHALGKGTSTDAGASVAPTSRSWVAWPPAGPVPIELFEDERIDVGGWTVQSSTSNLDDATLTVSAGLTSTETKNLRVMPIRVTHLEAQRGSRSAIRFVPDGWSTEVGHTYTVRIVYPSEPDVVFTVEPTDCP